MLLWERWKKIFGEGEKRMMVESERAVEEEMAKKATDNERGSSEARRPRTR